MSGLALLLGVPLFLGGLTLFDSPLAGARPAGVLLMLVAIAIARQAVKGTDRE